MFFNGNIELNAAGQSEIRNIVIERLAATPVFAANEAGRIVYNTTEKVVYLNNGSSYIAIATGGDAAALNSEVDAIEAAVGLDVDGGFVAWSGTNYLNAATSIKDGVTALDTQLASEASTRSSADTTLQNNINTEASTRATNDGDLGTLVTTVKTSLVAAINEVDGAYKTADGALQTNIDAEASTRATNDTTLQTNINTEASTRAANDGDLGTLATVVKTDLVSAINELHSDATSAGSAQATLDAAQDTAIAGKVSKAGDSMTGALNMGGTQVVTGLANPTAASDAANKQYVDSQISGLTWKAPVRAANLLGDGVNAPVGGEVFGDVYIVGAAASGAFIGYLEGDIVQYNGTGWIKVQDGAVAVGDRFIVAATSPTTPQVGFTKNDILVWNGTSFDVVVVADKEAVFVHDEDSLNFGQSYVYNATDLAWYKFSGPAAIGDGVGLYYDGNTLHVGLGAGIVELPSDEVGIDVHPNGGLITTIDGTTADATTGAQLHVKLDGSSLTVGSAGLKVTDQVLTDITDNASAITAETTRATGVEGTLTSLTTDVKTNLVAAINEVDANIDQEVTDRTNAIATETTARTTAVNAVQADVDANETAINNKVDAMYHLYTSGAAATSHVVTHNIGAQYCNVTVVHGTTDEQIIPESVTFNSPTQLTVTFNVAIDCKVVVMGLV